MKTTEEPELMLDDSDIARLLRISKSTVSRRCADGRLFPRGSHIEPVYVGKHLRRWRAAQVMAFLREV
ncbi:MAG: helix-turn-helix domain-containing protein [Bifidobacterium tibiigranuli]|jgi:predicted DNA-binding transcriptional regulator AlpA|nr:helix-turn-helix domain-containing protein [Bifidobacterium tibiigranuli]